MSLSPALFPLKAVSSQCCQRPTVRCHSVNVQRTTSQPVCRRAALLGLGAGLVSLPEAARALIPDDTDEELIEKLAAKRKSKLATERSVEADYLREGGYNSRALDKELVPVQRGVNNLAKSGAALEVGDLKAVTDAMGDGWVAEFTKACEDLSTTSAAKQSVTVVFASLSDLQTKAKSGELRAAKGAFVDTVTALEAWVADAGIKKDIKGI